MLEGVVAPRGGGGRVGREEDRVGRGRVTDANHIRFVG
jgi:hypothetical protein